MAGEVAGQIGNDHPTICPMGVFPAADGQINIAASTPASSSASARLSDGWTGWRTRRFSSTRRRTEHREALARYDLPPRPAPKRPAAWWIERLDDAGIPCGPILAIDQVFADPQVKHLGMATPVDHPRLGETRWWQARSAWPASKPGVRQVAPLAPADTDDVLAEIGYSAAEIAQMRAEHVV